VNSTLAGWLQVGLLFAALAACYIPLGNYIAKIFTTDKHWRVERAIFKATGINPDVDQTWGQYLRSMLAFSAVSVLFLYGMQRLQGHLFSFVGQPMAAVPANTSFNTAASFTTTRTGRTTRVSPR
jgi:potassium-transporting ATPase potassium-binding subunit